jgi:hypothetical protein
VEKNEERKVLKERSERIESKEGKGAKENQERVEFEEWMQQ